MAIRHRDITAESLGINAARYKLLAFSASTSLTCFSGALWAYHTAFVSVEAFDFHMLIQYLAMVIIGGLGSIPGACLGAVFVIALPHLISLTVERIPLLQGLGGKTFDYISGYLASSCCCSSSLNRAGLRVSGCACASTSSFGHSSIVPGNLRRLRPRIVRPGTRG